MLDEKIKTLDELVKSVEDFYRDQMVPCPDVMCYDGRRVFKSSKEIDQALIRLKESKLWMESYMKKVALKTKIGLSGE